MKHFIYIKYSQYFLALKRSNLRLKVHSGLYKVGASCVESTRSDQNGVGRVGEEVGTAYRVQHFLLGTRDYFYYPAACAVWSLC